MCRLEAQVSITDSSALGHTRRKSKCWLPGLFLSEGESSKLIHVIGTVQFLVAVGLTYSFPCPLTARGLSQLFKAICIDVMLSPSILRTASQVLLVLQISLTSPSATSLLLPESSLLLGAQHQTEHVIQFHLWL